MAPLNFSIPKVNVGSVNTRGKHNLSHNVATTFDFGRVQPVFCKLVTPDSHIKGSIDAKVRVMPMPLPPFGDVRMKLYGQFVSCKDLMHSYPEFLAGQTYSSSQYDYVPQYVPRLFNYIDPTISGFVNGKKDPHITFAHLLASHFFSKWTAYPVRLINDKGTQYLSDAHLARIEDKYGVFSLERFSTDLQEVTKAINQIVFGIHPDLFDTTNVGTMGFGTYNYVRSEASGDTVTSTQPDISEPEGLLAHESALGFNFTPESADLFFIIPYQKFIASNSTLPQKFIEIYENYVSGATSDTALCVAVSFNQVGRNLVTILRHLGINVNTFHATGNSNVSRKYVSLLPLFAYYKAYFDIFSPTRNVQWSSTNAHKILDWFNQTGSDLYNLYNDALVDKTHVNGYVFTSFLKDVALSYATCDPNYITQAVDSSTPTLSETISVDDELSGQGSYATTEDSVSAHYNISRDISRVGLVLLNQLSKFVNTNTVIGRNINAFLKAHFGSIGTNENSKFAGSADVPITLGDVIVTANTELSQPGDFSGVGFGSGDYNFSYKADEFGFFIVLASIIPVSNYVQGELYDNAMTERFDFPFPEFDALGYEKLDSTEILPLPMALPYGYESVSGSSTTIPKTVFGYTPRYTGYKVHPSVYSGSFSLRPLRKNYLGFTLDNYITQDETLRNGNMYSVYSPVSLTCGPLWRYVNKYPMYNNFERIFYQQRIASIPISSIGANAENNLYYPYEDNFVAYFDVKCSLVDHLKSISNSYDTLDGSDFYVNKQ